jgi:hypothetical protein
MLRFLVTANVVPSSPIPVTLMMKALRSSETSVLTRPTQCNIPGDSIIENYSVKNLSLCKLPLRSRYNEWLRAGRQRIRSSSPSKGKSFQFLVSSSPALWPTQSPVQWVPGVMRQRRNANNSPLSSTEEKKKWIRTSISPYVYHAVPLS